MEQSFQLGFVHFDRKDQDRYLAVLKQLDDEGAIDELGVGRIRDYYSNLLFPGMSVLQQHAKYFVVLPLLFKEAVKAKGGYRDPSDVRSKIRSLEIVLTKRLCEACPDAVGITGSDSKAVNNENGKGEYVKYDPLYIYRSGLKSFDIVLTESIEEAIFDASKLFRKRPAKLSASDNEQGDSEDEEALMPFCSCPEKEYDWEKECSLDLTRKEARFLRDHILNSGKCKGSLLHHILENGIPVSGFETFDSFLTALTAKDESLPEELKREAQLASCFSDLLDGLYYFYNWLYSGKTDETMWGQFLTWTVGTFHPKRTGMMDSLQVPFSLRLPEFNDDGSRSFCKFAIEQIRQKDWTGLESLIVERERKCKKRGSRWKIGNDQYRYDPQNPIHDFKVDFRWKTVRTIIGEIQEGLDHE